MPYLDERVVVLAALVPSLQLPHPQLLQKVLHDRLSPPVLRHPQVVSRGPHFPAAARNGALRAEQTLPRLLAQRLPLLSLVLPPSALHRRLRQHFHNRKDHSQRQRRAVLRRRLLQTGLGRLRNDLSVQFRFRGADDLRHGARVQEEQPRNDGIGAQELLLRQDHRLREGVLAGALGVDEPLGQAGQPQRPQPLRAPRYQRSRGAV